LESVEMARQKKAMPKMSKSLRSTEAKDADKMFKKPTKNEN